MSNRRLGVFALFVATAFARSLAIDAEPMHLAGPTASASASVDLPAGWRAEASGSGFSSLTGEARLRVIDFPGVESATAKGISDSIESQLRAHGEGSDYVYAGMPARISDVSFEAGGVSFRGYLIAIVGAKGAVALLGFATKDSYNRLHDEVLSALDSYSYDAALAEYPGPVSQFLYPFPAPHRTPMKIYVGRKELRVGVDVREIDVSQSIIDRETRVLAENKSVNVAAWRRFYRMIFRDNYHRIDDYLPVIVESLSTPSAVPTARAQSVLSWIQGFLYARTGTLADLSSPVLSLVTQTGDCDSRTLLYSIILHHLGIKNILMVSAVYSHSMVGLLVDGKGAHYAYRGAEYLVAELTAPVALGMIDQSMANAKGWVAVDLTPDPAR